MLTPSSGFCWTPLTNVGSGRPAASRTVGATSITCANWVRTSPFALIPAGQWTIVPFRVPPQCEATCFVHWYGVHIACAQPTAIVVVRVRAAEVVEPLDHELRRLQRGGAVEVDHLVVGAVQRALGRGAVVADDVVDERVLEDAEVLEGVEQPADVVVGELEEARVDLHLAAQHRLQLLRHVVPGRDLLVARGQLGVRRDHARAPSAWRRSARAARPSRRRTRPCTCRPTRE